MLAGRCRGRAPASKEQPDWRRDLEWLTPLTGGGHHFAGQCVVKKISGPSAFHRGCVPPPVETRRSAGLAERRQVNLGRPGFIRLERDQAAVVRQPGLVFPDAMIGPQRKRRAIAG